MFSFASATLAYYGFLNRDYFDFYDNTLIYGNYGGLDYSAGEIGGTITQTAQDPAPLTMRRFMSTTWSLNKPLTQWTFWSPTLKSYRMCPRFSTTLFRRGSPTGGDQRRMGRNGSAAKGERVTSVHAEERSRAYTMAARSSRWLRPAHETLC
jgi:hypothetical protein